MGKLIRNNIEYGGGNGTDIYEVTQSQYNTLKQAGTLVRNALYVITDAENLNCTAEDIEYSTGVSVKSAIDNICNYSLSEKIVGKWVDNKTLYEKTIDITPITTDSSWHNVAHGISNIDKVVYVNGIIINNSNEFVPIPNIRPAQILDNLPVGIEVNADRTNVRYMNNWLNNITYCWVTIRYTKAV